MAPSLRRLTTAASTRHGKEGGPPTLVFFHATHPVKDEDEDAGGSERHWDALRMPQNASCD